MFSVDPSRQDLFVVGTKKCKPHTTVILHARHSGPYFSGLLLPVEFEFDNCTRVKLRRAVHATAFDADLVCLRINASALNGIEYPHLPSKQVTGTCAPLRKTLSGVQSRRERIY